MRHLTKGFTLVEMIVTVTVLAILLAIAAPSYYNTIAGTRMSSEINSLQGALNLARSEAMKRGLSVSVCPVASPSSTTTACDTGSSNWTSGWVVLVNSTPTVLVSVSTGVTHSDSLTSPSTSTPPYPTFTPAGYTFFGQNPDNSDVIKLHDVQSTTALYRCIVFNTGSWLIQTGAACL